MSEKRQREEETPSSNNSKIIKWDDLDFDTFGVFPRMEKGRGLEELEGPCKLYSMLPKDLEISCSDGSIFSNKYIWDILFFQKPGFSKPEYRLPFKSSSVKQCFADYFGKEPVGDETLDLEDYVKAWEYLDGDIYSLKYNCTRWFMANAGKISAEKYASICSSPVEIVRRYAMRKLFEPPGWVKMLFIIQVNYFIKDLNYKDELFAYRMYTGCV